MSIAGFTFRMDSDDTIMARRGLHNGGKVQKCVDSEVVRHMEPYIPMLSGVLKGSIPLSTVYGSGEVNVNTPYAHRRSLSARTNGLRGPHFFERMKADHKDDILRTAAGISGGTAK